MRLHPARAGFDSGAGSRASFLLRPGDWRKLNAADRRRLLGRGASLARLFDDRPTQPLALQGRREEAKRRSPIYVRRVKEMPDAVRANYLLLPSGA
jgi:hypothetical protein